MLRRGQDRRGRQSLVWRRRGIMVHLVVTIPDIFVYHLTVEDGAWSYLDLRMSESAGLRRRE